MLSWSSSCNTAARCALYLQWVLQRSKVSSSSQVWLLTCHSLWSVTCQLHVCAVVKSRIWLCVAIVLSEIPANCCSWRSVPGALPELSWAPKTANQQGHS